MIYATPCDAATRPRCSNVTPCATPTRPPTPRLNLTHATMPCIHACTFPRIHAPTTNPQNSRSTCHQRRHASCAPTMPPIYVLRLHGVRLRRHVCFTPPPPPPPPPTYVRLSNYASDSTPFLHGFRAMMRCMRYVATHQLRRQLDGLRHVCSRGRRHHAPWFAAQLRTTYACYATPPTYHRPPPTPTTPRSLMCAPPTGTGAAPVTSHHAAASHHARHHAMRGSVATACDAIRSTRTVDRPHMPCM